MIVHSEMALPPNDLCTILEAGQSTSTKEEKIALQQLLLKLAKCKKIVVVAGAGISVNSGIPDFRSAGGLYDMVKEKYPKSVAKGQELFDANFFQSPSNRPVFYRFMGLLKEMIDGAKPTKCHQLIKNLKDCGWLTRMYTQNIDCIEKMIGLECSLEQGNKNGNLVLLHGTMEYVRCTLCKHRATFDDSMIELYKNGNQIECTLCLGKREQRVQQGKRATSVGVYRPDIVLYNEAHPNSHEISDLLSADLARRPDALIVLGTSLKVVGIKKMVKCIASAVKEVSGPVIYINKSNLTTLEWKRVFTHELVGCADYWAEVLQREWIGSKRLIPTKIDQYFNVIRSPMTSNTKSSRKTQYQSDEEEE